MYDLIPIRANSSALSEVGLKKIKKPPDSTSEENSDHVPVLAKGRNCVSEATEENMSVVRLPWKRLGCLCYSY